LASKFLKSANDLKKYFCKKSKRCQKNGDFHADFKSVEKVLKKVISKTSLTNMSKSEKGAYFRYVLVHFLNFPTDSKSE
jgi:hypothetical protein